MGELPVDQAETILYLTFTLTSIIVSLISYCLYFHCMDTADSDYQSYEAFYREVGKMEKRERYDIQEKGGHGDENVDR